MGKTKTKIIDDSAPQVEEPKKRVESKAKPKDALVGSLLEELNQEFGEAKSKEEPKEKETIVKKQDTKSETKKVVKKEAKETPKGKYRSKKYQEATDGIERNKRYALSEAIELTQKSSYSKFPGTVEIHLNTNAKNIRGLISLPFASGKKLRILAFGKNAEQSGADIIGSDETIAEIEKSKNINFDVLVTTPEWMSKLAKIAKILGPKGLMPNPKNGTITENLEKAVADLQGGKIEYKTEKDAQVIHLPIGKVSQPGAELSANVKTLYQIIGKSRIKKITLSTTMGPGVKVELNSI